MRPRQPTASVKLPEAVSLNEGLDFAYACTQHGNRYASWFHDPEVIPHLRSSSVCDLLATAEGTFYVIEPMGFKPYVPTETYPVQQLVGAVCLLEKAAAQRELGLHQQAVQASLVAIQHALAAEGYSAQELPVDWENAQVGDLVGSPALGHFRIIARKLRPKWRARQMLADLPNGTIWLDGAKTWAVLVLSSVPDLSKRWL
ncbi:MAG: hypothetical protein H6657_24600 [Ardenticatenaceae bacterium]|nr:hypothetical protein [Ardenticatenaceae bacterium]